LNGKLKFQRTFLIFKQEDAGYGAGQTPSGYVKIEARDGKGKLTAVVENLKEGSNQFSYMLYILKHDGGRITPVCVGKIPLNKNNGEIKWDFNAENVAGTGCRIEEFKTAIVLVEFGESENRGIICPLAACKDTNEEWRNKLKSVLYPDKREKRDEEERIKKEEITSKYTGGLESKYIPPEDTPEFNIPQSAVEHSPESAEETGLYDSYEETDIGNARSLAANNTDDSKTFEEGKTDDSDAPGELNINRQNSETDCIFSDNSFCAMQAYNKGANPCANCHMNNIARDKDENPRASGDMLKFKKSLDEVFEIYDPFGSRRRDYKWWKVNNPVYLNNILYQCSIKTPLLFNPTVIMSHFKYRYLIVGIYTDRVRRREYIVCGIPGVYKVDDKPFGDMCRWVQMEGSRPKYGAFGYWLVYIDPRTGKFLKLN